MIIKICGIQTIADAQAAICAGAHWLGFVFAKSKRKITISQAKKIVQSIKQPVQTVGVFVNENISTMESIAKQVGLTMIQLHGDESPEIISQLSLPTIKAFPIDQLKTIDINQYPGDYLLIDSQRTTYYGGSGKTFDWELLKHNKQINFNRLILAGGLSADNVQLALQTVHPAGVDVSSGVEMKGKKDQQKMIDFVKQVKNIQGGDNFDKLYVSK